MNLRRHPDKPENLTNIVNNLTEKLYAHNHMIPRQEALNFGLPVVMPSVEEEELIWALYSDYAEALGLGEPFNPVEILHDNCTEFEVASGIVESMKGLDAFIFNGIVEKREGPDPRQVNVSILKQGWRALV